MSYTMSRVVMTTGVSAFSPMNQFRAWCQEQKLLDFASPSPNPAVGRGQTIEAAVGNLRSSLEKLCLPDVADRKRVSAEYSGLAALGAGNRLVEHPNVVLVHTDTLGGTAAALIVKRLLERDFSANVELSEVTLDVDDRDRLRFEMGNYMHVVASALRGWDTATTCFMPLGGYKVMTSLGYLAGAYFGFPTLYTHEDNQVLHEIPAVPIKVSRQEVERLAPLMKAVSGGCALKDLTDDQKKQVKSATWLFEQVDDLVSVNAFGLFLMQEPEYVSLFTPILRISARVAEAMRTGGHDRFIRQQLSVLGSKLTAKSTEQDLQHEKQWGLRSEDGRHLYKGASNGDLPFRCLYRFDANRLEILAVWTNHDAYEREAKHEWTKSVVADRDLP